MRWTWRPSTATMHKEGSEDSPKIQALIEALQTDAVKQYIADTYNGAVVTIF